MRTTRRARFLGASVLAPTLTVAALGACLDLGDTNMDWRKLDRPEPPAPVDSGPPDEDAGDAGEEVDSSTPPPDHAEVLIFNLAFDPPHVRVARGGTVTWFNLDPVQHDVRSGSPAAPTATFNSGLLDRSDTYGFVFDDAGAYEYYCSTHAKQMYGATVDVVEVSR